MLKRPATDPLSKIQFSLLIAKIIGFTFWLQILPIQTNARLLLKFHFFDLGIFHMLFFFFAIGQ